MGAGLEVDRVGCLASRVGLRGALGPPAHHPTSLNSCSDITEEDLEEAGVQDPAHKRLLLDTLQLSK